MKDKEPISAIGKVILTTLRMIFISNNQKGAFKSFDLPLPYIYNEGFGSKLLGSDYLEGKCMPLQPELQGKIDDFGFKLRFQSGGFSSFIRFFNHQLNSLRDSSIKQK